MAQYNQPGRLETLSQMAVGEYISFLCIRLVNLVEADGDNVDPVKLVHAERVCARVQKRLHSAIPRMLANDMTSEMLKHVDYCCKDIHNSFSQPWFEKILTDIVKAILHPDLTIIDLTWEWTYIAQFVFHHIINFDKLEVLKLGKRHISSMVEGLVGGENIWIQSFVQNTAILSNLEILSIFSYCADNILKILADNCRKLRHLDVNGSKNVTDESIEYILKITTLEELDLSGTSISVAGYIQLVQQLGKSGPQEDKFHPHALKSFGCDCYTTFQLDNIVSELKNLTEINLIVRNCDVALLRRLDSLQNLSIKWGGFSAVKELLRVKGNQIVELKLDLDFSASVDLKFVAENCPNLQNMTVSGDTCATNVADEKEFPSITHITLETRNSSAAEYLLSRCHNLTVLELCTVREFYDTFMPRVLSKNSFSCLEQLIMGSKSETLHTSTIQLISTHCKNLSVFKIFGYSQAETERLCQLFPGVRVKCDSRWQFPTFVITHSPESITRFRKFCDNIVR